MSSEDIKEPVATLNPEVCEDEDNESFGKMGSLFFDK